MSLLLLEALGALLLLLLIVWWTMFSGRRRGELPAAPAIPDDAAAPKSTSSVEKT
jgi:cbb3-type cytochrome oxidase subunit 3